MDPVLGTTGVIIVKIIGGIFTTIGTIWGGRHVWAWYKTKDSNDAAITMQREANRAKQASVELAADIASGTRAERVLKSQVERLETHVTNLEARMDKLEKDRNQASLRAADLEAEGRVKDSKISHLQNKLDAACKLLKEKGVDDSIIEILRSE